MVTPQGSLKRDDEYLQYLQDLLNDPTAPAHVRADLIGKILSYHQELKEEADLYNGHSGI